MPGGVRTEGNVTAREQQIRMRVGVVSFAAALFAGIVLVRSGISAGYRTFLVIPFFLSTVSFFSSTCRTCGVMAVMGKRRTCDGMERIADKDEISRFRAAARRSTLQALAASVLVTLPFILI